MQCLTVKHSNCSGSKGYHKKLQWLITKCYNKFVVVVIFYFVILVVIHNCPQFLIIFWVKKVFFYIFSIIELLYFIENYRVILLYIHTIGKKFSFIIKLFYFIGKDKIKNKVGFKSNPLQFNFYEGRCLGQNWYRWVAKSQIF